MKLVKLTPDNHDEIIQLACQTLANGGLVVYPTETTYGIGADCENEMAIAKLLDYKSKRDGKPLSVAVADIKIARKYVELNETAQNLYKTFLPGPLTVISKSLGKTAKGVASAEGTLGIRISSHPFAGKLNEKYGKGITATGANASYQKRPYEISDIMENISQRQKELLDLVIDAGKLPPNEPSTVVNTTLDDIQVSRFGSLKFTNKETFHSKDVDATESIAAGLISRYRSKLTYRPIVIALSGQMGAGKTHFVKGIAKGLRIQEPITSPTYTLANEHKFISENRTGTLLHIDTWKMSSKEEFESLRIENTLDNNGVVVIEWADKFEESIKLLSQKYTVIWVEILGIGNDRDINISHLSSE